MESKRCFHSIAEFYASDYNFDSVTSEKQSLLKFEHPRKTRLRSTFVSLQSNGDLTSCSTRFALNNFVFGYKESLLSHSDNQEKNYCTLQF